MVPRRILFVPASLAALAAILVYAIRKAVDFYLSAFGTTVMLSSE
jgi:hypothetical protein